MRPCALSGDSTTTGGRVLDGSPSVKIGSRAVARQGDPVFCPACKQTGHITESDPQCLVQGRPMARHDSLVACGCPPGSHRLVGSGKTVQFQR